MNDSANQHTSSGPRATTATILFAGGGTGGHISPGLAVAEALERLRPDLGRIFACSERKIDRAMLDHAGARFVPLAAMPFGRRPAQLVRFVRGWRRAVSQSLEIIDAENVRAVVALGGFVAAPVVAAARKRGVPQILLNLDAVPGKANRFMARRGATVLSTCDLAQPDPAFPATRIAMPLRQSTLASSWGDQQTCRQRLGLDAHAPTLLVTGASQGSQSLNDLIRSIVERHREWLAGWQIHHLTGPGRDAEMHALYSQAGMKALVEPFRADMGLAWGAADLVISRAGANSVAEIAANAVPAVFFPYPYHTDRHQFHNARPVVDLGGAVLCEDFIDPERNLREHGETVRRLLCDQAARGSMRRAMEASRPENGADVVAQRVLAMMGSNA